MNVGVYVRTGPPRRLPKGPPWPGHGPLDPVYDAGGNVFHWLSQGPERTVSCEVCGLLGRLRRRDARRSPYYDPARRRRTDQVLMAVNILLGMFIVFMVVTAVLGTYS